MTHRVRNVMSSLWRKRSLRDVLCPRGLPGIGEHPPPGQDGQDNPGNVKSAVTGAWPAQGSCGLLGGEQESEERRPQNAQEGPSERAPGCVCSVERSRHKFRMRWGEGEKEIMDSSRARIKSLKTSQALAWVLIPQVTCR